MNKRLTSEYKSLANPSQMDQFCDGNGALSNLNDIGDAYNYNHRARKLDWLTHFRGHVLLMTTGYKSTRDHAWAGANDPLFSANGAAVDISFSGLAQANRNRPIEPLMEALEQVLGAVGQLPHTRLRHLDKKTWRGIVGILNQTSIFDATMIGLPPKLSEWAAGNREGSASLKLQLRLDGREGAFRKIILTPATGNDSPYLDDLLGDLDRQEDQYFIFDGGYWEIDKFHDIVDSGNHFVAKRGGNIKPHIIKELPLPRKPLQSGYEVLQDARVHLGNRTDKEFRMLRVRQTEGQEIVLLTSLLDLSADRICLMYRYRWTIEIVFRYIKQILQLDHFVSHDPTGVIRQILMALIGTIALYDEDGMSLHTIYAGATPEYGKSVFLERMENEINRIKVLHLNAKYVGLADGAKDNWPFLEKHTDQQLIDFYHASEYIGKVGNAAIKKGESRDWIENACHNLKHKPGAAGELLLEMEQYLEKRISKEKKEKVSAAATYFKNNIHRMDYATNIAENLPIGSGVTEAACKVIVKQRLCRSGMKWKGKGASVVLTLRCLNYTEERWEQFWRKIDRYGFDLAAQSIT